MTINSKNSVRRFFFFLNRNVYRLRQKKVDVVFDPVFGNLNKISIIATAFVTYSKKRFMCENVRIFIANVVKKKFWLSRTQAL